MKIDASPRWIALPAALVAALSVSGPARGAEQAYKLAQGKDGPGITTTISYSMGTHDNRVTRAEGELKLDPAAPEGLTGELRVPIDAIVSGDNERDCHMRESLGLDYAKSKFPNEHVCQDDKLPKESIAFPDVRLSIRSASAPKLADLPAGKETPITALASWTIHGVTRPAKLHLSISPDAATPGAVRIRGLALVPLKEFGVVVKSAKVLFATISVGQVVNVRFDLQLVPAR